MAHWPCGLGSIALESRASTESTVVAFLLRMAAPASFGLSGSQLDSEARGVVRRIRGNWVDAWANPKSLASSANTLEASSAVLS